MMACCKFLRVLIASPKALRFSVEGFCWKTNQVEALRTSASAIFVRLAYFVARSTHNLKRRQASEQSRVTCPLDSL